MVFVADSQVEQRENNADFFRYLQENVERRGAAMATFPYVLQLNKRDLPNAEPVADLAEAFSRGRPVVEASAANGNGVLATLRAIIGEISAETKTRVDWDALVPRPGLRAFDEKSTPSLKAPASQLTRKAPVRGVVGQIVDFFFGFGL